MGTPRSGSRPIYRSLDDAYREALESHRKWRVENDSAAGDWAETLYTQILDSQPDHPEILNACGAYYCERGKVGLALALLEKACEKSPRHPALWGNLGHAHTFRYDTPEARKAYRKSLKLDPKQPAIMAALGASYLDCGEGEEALRLIDAAIAADPAYEDAQWNRAHALLELGRYGEAWPGYLKGPRSTTHRIYMSEGREVGAWDGSPNQRILVYGEQGIGDEVMFASCLADLEAVSAKVYLDCNYRLVSLLQRSFPKLTVFSTDRLKPGEGGGLPFDEAYDAVVALGNLPAFFRPSRESFPGTPYLKPQEFMVRNFREQAAGKLSIGISWTGGTQATRQTARSIPLVEWGPIFQAAPGARFVSLQYTDGAAEQAAEAAEMWGVEIHHEPLVIADMESLTAQIAACGLIVSVCTANVHIAGALGKSVIVMVPRRAAWRYAQDLPWYSNITMVRQVEDKPSAWPAAVKRAGEILRERMLG